MRSAEYEINATTEPMTVAALVIVLLVVVATMTTVATAAVTAAVATVTVAVVLVVRWKTKGKHSVASEWGLRTGEGS